MEENQSSNKWRDRKQLSTEFADVRIKEREYMRAIRDGMRLGHAPLVLTTKKSYPRLARMQEASRTMTDESQSVYAKGVHQELRHSQ